MQGWLIMIEVRNRQNGQTQQLKGPKTVSAILKELGLVEGSVLIMRDGQLLTRDVRVEDGDRIEIIPVISGG